MKSQSDLTITGVTPSWGVPGGELIIDCRGFVPGLNSRVQLGDVEVAILSASENRVIVRLPESPNCLGLTLKVEETASAVFPFVPANRLATDLHPVTNPVIAPDGNLITTVSGSRGQQVPQPLVKITRRGDKIPFHCEIMNPTGLAFSRDGQLHISSRHDSTVLRYTNYEELEVVAEDLGVPCGIVFDSEGMLYVGDRTGKIYRVDPAGNREEFARMEPSISAYHLAIDREDRLYVTGPTFSMRDNLVRFSKDASAEILVRGLARPQGMVCLPDGDLLVATAFQGKKGIFRYSAENGSFQHYITAPILIGLAIAGQEAFLANSTSIYHAQLSGKSSVN
jgi:hypothetical protein